MPGVYKFLMHKWRVDEYGFYLEFTDSFNQLELHEFELLLKCRM